MDEDEFETSLAQLDHPGPTVAGASLLRFEELHGEPPNDDARRIIFARLHHLYGEPGRVRANAARAVEELVPAEFDDELDDLVQALSTAEHQLYDAAVSKFQALSGSTPSETQRRFFLEALADVRERTATKAALQVLRGEED